MKQHPINQLLNISLDNVVRMVDTGKIVGQPIYLGDNRQIIPISRVTFGFGVGGSEFSAKKDKIILTFSKNWIYWASNQINL